MTMSALYRDLLGMDRRLRAGDWRDHRSNRQPELRGRTIAVLGLGRIGTAVSRMAAAYQMRITAIANFPDPIRRDERGLAFLGRMNELPAILPGADFVVVAMPLNESTRGFIGADEFRMMKSSAYLVNVARGPLVDEAALFEAMRDCVIAGAAIAVWYRYPVGDELAQP